MTVVEGATPARGVPDAPVLRFRLIGQWSQLDLRSEEAAATSIRRYIETLVGSGDSEAQTRALLRRSLHEGVGMAREASAVSMFLAREITPGTPMPVTLTVYSPTSLKMSPAIGASPAAVADVLQEGLRTLVVDGVDTLTRLEIDGSHVVRVHREHEDPVHPQVPRASVRKLLVDYWYTVPGSKQVVLVSFMTPLVALGDTMLSFFDSIVRASWFDTVSHDGTRE